MLYLDTSVVVAAHTNEAATGRIQDRLAEQDPGEIAISDWVVAEFSSALALKLRARQIGAADRAAALAMFARLASETFIVLGPSRSHFRAAARIADQHALGLRASDALHLAICLEAGATLWTLDRRQAEAGRALGAVVELL